MVALAWPVIMRGDQTKAERPLQYGGGLRAPSLLCIIMQAGSEWILQRTPGSRID